MESKAVTQPQEKPEKRSGRWMNVVTSTDQLKHVLRPAAFDAGGVELTPRSVFPKDQSTENARIVNISATDAAALTRFSERVNALQPDYFNRTRGISGERHVGLGRRTAPRKV